MAVLLDVEHLLPAGGESPSTKSVAVPSGTTKIVVFAGNVLFNPRTVSGITFNTTEAFTAVTGGAINETTPSVREEAWFLDNPTITTANVVVTWSGPARGGVRIVCLDATANGQPAAVNTGQVSGAVSASTVAVNTSASGIVLSGYTVRRGDATTAALTAGTDLLNGIGSPTAGDASSRLCAGSQAGTGGSVSTTWTPTGTGDRAAHVVLAIGPPGPSITTQPTAQTVRLNGEATTAATFTVAATTSGGTLLYDWELETSVGGGVFANLADGSGATWTGQTATSCVGTFTATTLTGRTVRCNVTDDNGTVTTDAVALSVFAGPVTTASSSSTNGSGVGTLTYTSDDALTTNGECLLWTVVAGRTGNTSTFYVTTRPSTP